MGSLLLASLLWAASFGLIKDRLSGYDAGMVAAARLALAALVFSPWLRRGGAVPRERMRLALLGALQFGLMYILYIASYGTLPAWAVAVFTVFTPLYVAWIEGAQARRVRGSVWLGSMLAVLGAGVVAWRGLPDAGAWRGVLLLQGANLCFAAGQVLYRRRRGGGDDAGALAWMYLGAAVLAGGSWLLRAAPVGRGWNVDAVVAIAYLGVLPTGVGFWLWNRGAASASIGAVAALNNLKIPLAVAAAWLVFGERTDPLRLGAGLALVVAATVLAGRGVRAAPEAK